ncbi:MAG TPA: cytochrome c oxidase assembly protein, partial [Acidimicrobiales bacterium]
LVGGVAALAVYALRVVGPKVVPKGRPVVTRQQLVWLVLGIALLWVASDWPMHDIAEEYLFSVHMVQHLLLTYFVPPMLLLATPERLARLVLGRGKAKQAFYFLARPVPAALLFCSLQLFTHVPGVVNTSVQVGPVHYLLHTALVSSALLMWMPVCGPLPELRISYPAQMLYLFVISIIPTVPAAWLTFADGVVYSAYDVPARLWGISVTSDQQAAGAIMKLVGGSYLWVIITLRFFQWAAKFSDTDKAADQAGPAHELHWDDEVRPEAAAPTAGTNGASAPKVGSPNGNGHKVAHGPA